TVTGSSSTPVISAAPFLRPFSTSKPPPSPITSTWGRVAITYGAAETFRSRNASSRRSPWNSNIGASAVPSCAMKRVVGIAPVKVREVDRVRRSGRTERRGHRHPGREERGAVQEEEQHHQDELKRAGRDRERLER